MHVIVSIYVHVDNQYVFFVIDFCILRSANAC